MSIWLKNLTPQQQQEAQQMLGSFAGTAGANLYGDSEKWRAGRGVIVLGRGERKNTTYGTGLFVEAKIEWFRGGVDINGNRVPDDALRAGDPVLYKIMDNNSARQMLFKSFALACTRAKLVEHKLDPESVQAEQITDADPAAIIASQGQDGLRVAFTSTARLTKEGNRLYHRIMLEGGHLPDPPPMTVTTPAPSQPQAQPQAQPNPFAQPQPAAQPNPFAQQQPQAQPNPFAQPQPAAQPQAQPSPFAQQQAQPNPFAQPQPAAQPNPFAQPQPNPFAQPAPMTRDQMIAAIKAKMPHLAGADLSGVPDEQLAAQL
jgi:hypothetical protein